MNRFFMRFLTLALFITVAGCSTQPAQPVRSPDQIRARIVQLLPSTVQDRQGWATDIQTAFAVQELDPTDENICSVLAVTEQESTFQADPPVPGLAKIARSEINRRASKLHIPEFVLRSALNITSPNGKTYNQRLDTARTEGQLSAIFDDFIGMVPLGKTLFGSLNPVHTGGPMQVSIAFAQKQARDYPYPVTESIRHEVFTRRGGMYFGIAHLLGYPVDYPRSLYRFADFNAGWYASRNAAFQNAVSKASGIPLALDGDLTIPDSYAVGATERAVRALGKQLDLSENAIRNQLLKGNSLDFNDTAVYQRVYALADRKNGQPLPRAVLPGISLQSPKITRNLTTAWFAQRVDERRQRCMNRAKALASLLKIQIRTI